MRNCEFLACFIVQLHLHQTQQTEAAYNNVPDDHIAQKCPGYIYAKQRDFLQDPFKFYEARCDPGRRQYAEVVQ